MASDYIVMGAFILTGIVVVVVGTVLGKATSIIKTDSSILDDSKIYYKVMKQNLNHRGFQYKLGENILDVPFSPIDDPGGFYICNLEDVVCWLNLYVDLELVYEVKLYTDSKTQVYTNRIKTDKLHLANPILIETFLEKHNLITQAICTNNRSVKYVEKLTTDEYMKIIKSDINYFHVIPKEKVVDYDKMCLDTVQLNGLMLKYIEKQTPELCLLAVTNNSMAIKFVEKQTPELCLLAVTNNSMAIQFVEKQPPELCLLAVKQNIDAFEYIRE